jgi:DNA gyrase subunit A
LHRLTALEQDKILNEFEELLGVDCKELLQYSCVSRKINGSYSYLNYKIVKAQFGDKRRTEVIASQEDLTYEDLITEEDVVVTLSHQGYAKYQPISTYQAQRSGGKGKSATNVKDEDFIEKISDCKYA